MGSKDYDMIIGNPLFGCETALAEESPASIDCKDCPGGQPRSGSGYTDEAM